MLRIMFWVFIYLLTLGALSYEVEYRDGLRINLKGWYFKRENKTETKIKRRSL